MGLQKGEPAGWRGVDDPLEVGKNWDGEMNRFVIVTRLRFGELKEAVFDVLSSKTDDVRSALPGVEQKRKCQAGLRADRPSRLKLLDLSHGPRVKWSLSVLHLLDTDSWIGIWLY